MFQPKALGDIKKTVQNLLLNTGNIVVNIFLYSGKYIDWSSKRKRTHHLAELLNLAPSAIDILKL